jgi:HEAT repeat protein
MDNAMTPSLGIFTTDEQLRVRTWDDWLARVTGISADDARGKPLTALIPDLEAREQAARFQRVLAEGSVQVLATAFHQYLIPCSPTTPSRYFDRMQQRVTLAPLKEDERVVGVMATIEDVTAQRERERELMDSLASTHEETRLRAAEQLARAKETAPALTHALGDESWRVRRVAVEGLARSGSAEAVAALIRALRDEHHDLGVLNSALQVLMMSGVDTLTPLVELLHDPQNDLRIYAAQALGEQRDPRAIPPLLAALNDPDANVRYHAIEALGKLRATAAIEHLLAFATSDDFFLAFPALDALARIGDPSIAPRIVSLLQNDLLCAPAADVLGELGDEQVVAPLAALLNLPAAPTAVIASALVAIYQRYETRFGEGAHIADLARGAISAAGAQNLITALDTASDQELGALAFVLGWLEGAAVERALTRLLGQPTGAQSSR